MVYNIEISQRDITTLYGALAELPLRVSYGLFTSIQAQQKAQDENNAVDLADLANSMDAAPSKPVPKAGRGRRAKEPTTAP